MRARPADYIRNASDRELDLWLDQLLEYCGQPLPKIQMWNVKRLADYILEEIADRKVRALLEVR